MKLDINIMPWEGPTVCNITNNIIMVIVENSDRAVTNPSNSDSKSGVLTDRQKTLNSVKVAFVYV
jgi:hypothetical protein